MGSAPPSTTCAPMRLEDTQMRSTGRGWHRAIGIVFIGLVALVAAPTVAAAAPGDLDPSFSGDGIRWLDLGRQEGAIAVFRDSRGRLTLVGSSDSPYREPQVYRFAATRLLPDGHVDQSYGTNGRAIVDPTSQQDVVQAASKAPDGSVVILGSRQTAPGPGGSRDLGYVMARITPGGRLDRSFGTRGVVTGVFSSTARYQGALDVLVLPKGKILLLGSTVSRSNEERAVLRRFRSDGRVDPSFGSNGTVRTTGIQTGSILRQPGGKLVVAGGAEQGFRARRFRSDGRLDRSFGVDGLARLNVRGTGIDYTDHFRAALGTGGTIRIIGWGMNQRTFETDVVVGAFSSGGRVVTGFGDAGWTRIDHGNVDSPRAIKVLSDGRVVVVGSWWESMFDDEGSSDPAHVWTSLLLPDGSPDGGFGTGGTVVTDLSHGTHPPGRDAAFLNAVVVSGGRITVAGTSGGYRYADFLVMRYVLTE